MNGATSSPDQPAQSMPMWLEWMLSNVQTGLLLLDAQEHIAFANKWVLKRAAMRIEDIQGQALLSVFPVLAGSHFERALRTSIRSGFPSLLSQTLHPSPFPLYADDVQRDCKKALRQSIQILPMGPKDAAQAGQRFTLVQISDVTPNVLREGLLKAHAEKLSDMALIDGLTGVGNRRAFDESLVAEVRAAGRTSKPLALVMLDIDYFKQFNDHYGHPAGDSCLRTIASLLRRICRRPRDLVARYGGEEMVLVLPETDLSGAVRVAAEILQSVRDLALPHAMSLAGPVVSLSAGVSAFDPVAPLTGAQLLQQADDALYAAKRNGRNRLYVVDSARQQIVPG